VGRAAKEVFAGHPYWRQSEEQERKVRIGLIKALRAAKLPDGRAMVTRTDKVLTVLRREL
jgi:hypothetical protein